MPAEHPGGPPTVNAYKRFAAQELGPYWVDWGRDNRSVYVRIPNETGPATRIEFRGGDGSASPYLTAAAAIFAGIDGVARKLDPGLPTDAIYEPPADRPRVPLTLAEALDELEADAYIRGKFGEQFLQAFATLKRTDSPLHRLRGARAATDAGGSDVRDGVGASRVRGGPVTTELDVDLASPDTFAAGIPHEFFARKRREEPVFWHPERSPNSGFWAVTRYDDLVTVHKDWETFSSELGHVGLEELQPDELEVRRSMLETDPPRHTRLRRIVSPLFTPRAVGRYENYARELARDVLERTLGRPGAGTQIELEMLAEIAEPSRSTSSCGSSGRRRRTLRSSSTSAIG